MIKTLILLHSLRMIQAFDNINIDDDNFDDDDRETIVLVRLMAWCIRYKQRKANKNDRQKYNAYSKTSNVSVDWCMAKEEKSQNDKGTKRLAVLSHFSILPSLSEKMNLAKGLGQFQFFYSLIPRLKIYNTETFQQIFSSLNMTVNLCQCKQYNPNQK